MSSLTPISIDPENLSSQLAYDVASKLLTVDDILVKYELTREEFMRLVKTDEFKKLYAEAKLAWEGDAKARIQAKAAMAVEDSLLTVHSMLVNDMVPATARLEAFKQLKSIAGVEPDKKETGTGAHVAISINLGDAGGTTIEATATPIASDDST